METKNWKLIGGKHCIDFVNTVGGRIQQNENNIFDYKISADKFMSFSDILDWGKETGILNKNSANNLKLFVAENEKEGEKIFNRALVLREALYRIFMSCIYGLQFQKEDINLLNIECTSAREEQKLFYSADKFTWGFDPKIIYPESILWNISISASELLVSDQLKRVKQCPGNNCGWLFLDTSKNGSRQWCDMKDCGNLAKVRRHREKKK